MNLNILLVIIGVLLMFLAIYLLPKWQTKRIIDFSSKRWQAENEFRKTLIQMFGGLVVILSLLFTWGGMSQSQRNFEKGQNITRFSQAISFLGANNTEQKIGGIYTLEQIAKESPEEYLGTVIEVLSAVVRNAEVEEIKEDAKKPEEKKETKGDKENPKEKKEAIEQKEDVIKEKYKIKPETQIAMTVLGRIRTEDNKKHWENLPRINLVNAKLMGAHLEEANLTGANLMEADLEEAYLMYADLGNAKLIEANLTGANLMGANLMEADLMLANLTGANLMEADLTGVKLILANLTGAKLKLANLRGAKLMLANLRGAKLMLANLMETDLGNADLMEANLTGANLTGAKKLKVEQLLKAETLFKVMGLPPEMKKELKERKGELFEKPK